MKVIETKIKGLLIFQPTIFEDERGYFFESFNKKWWKENLGEVPDFVQDNESKSNKGVLRGLHFQIPPFTQGKLVRVISGSVLDIAVDLRKNSPTFGQHEKVILSAGNKQQFYMPEGFAHGFLTLENDTIFSYKCTNYYNKEAENGLPWNDPTLAINWEIENPVLSDKDKQHPSFISYNSPF